jgi:tRNA/rRNA methyltransferase
MAGAGQFMFVLVRPRSAGNVGAAARALKNMGFSELRLVEPGARDGRAAQAMAVHGRDVLERARGFATLAQALDGCTLTVGTTCRAGPYREHARPIREAAADLVRWSASNRIALVFGPEDNGLSNREIGQCRQLVTIPAAAQYPSLNLAQAVIIVAYELMLASGGARAAASGAQRFAEAGQVDAMLARMAEALVAIGFLPADNPEHIMFALGALFGRSGLTEREVDILSGIASQMRWVAEGGHATLSEKRRRGARLR